MAANQGGVKLRFRDSFFDREAVIKAVGRARGLVLAEMGRRVRKRAQASLKYADGPSTAGSPPHAHRTRTILRRSRRTGAVLISKRTGKARQRSVSFLREFLYYQFDPATKGVVIGPERLGSTVDPNALPALEYGGPAKVASKGSTRQVTIPGRPFMRPALAAERTGFAQLWRDSVK